ncbi:MTH938/NDUFAF3 family protein [Sphingomonas sp. ID0503]|uniref:MTH938/NDUFAF3 family protein n=1 Tax=Sphingomonas sp. ID0503 TaxID=3399691 RepID=UPI003AFB4CF0
MVRGFSGSGFKVNDLVFPGGVMMTTEEAWEWDAPALDALSVADLEPLLTAGPPPEFVLLGTGTTMRMLPELAKALEARDIGLAAMDSRAAARAWAVLRGEGRQVAAALIGLDRA